MTQPIAFALEEASAIKEEQHDFSQLPLLEPSETTPSSRLALWFWGGMSGLLSLSFGLWAASLIEAAFTRFPPLAYFALACSLIVALVGLLFFIKEMRALRYLQKVSHLQERPTAHGVLTLLERNPLAARGVNAYRLALKDALLDERDKLTLIENLILKPLDEEAIKLISSAAKRVSMVTALSPRAIIDVVMVFLTALTLMRRLAKLYGARAGTLAFIRLTRQTFIHLTLTASLAFGESLLHQMLGAGLAAKLSAKLGEGVVNGFLTARLGLAALRATRPMVFKEEQPTLKTIMNEVVRTS